MSNLIRAIEDRFEYMVFEPMEKENPYGDTTWSKDNACDEFAIWLVDKFIAEKGNG